MGALDPPVDGAPQDSLGGSSAPIALGPPGPEIKRV